MSRLALTCFAVFCAAPVLTGCRHAQLLPPETAAKLKETPQGYVSGEVKGLAERHLLNNKDFVYSVAMSPDGERAAFSHLGPQQYQVGLWTLGEQPKQLADPNINHYQYDVESLDFSPDGKVVVTASRDGTLRFFAFETGALIGEYRTEEPLVAVAFHPKGDHVVAGSAKGLVSVVTWPTLEFAFEQRAHEGEVRQVAFASDGTLYSGGWDKSIAVFEASLEETSVNQARLRFDRRGGFSVVRGMLNGKAPGAFAFDARLPYVVVTTEIAKAAGLDIPFLKDEVTIATPMGQTVARVAKNQTLTFKALRAEGIDIAVCDACVPAETQGILGAPFSDRYDVAFDQVTEEIQISSKDKSRTETRKVLALKPKKRLTFDWFVNDFSLDRTGRYLGVAFSEIKAERTREIYEREKKGIPEPTRDGNNGAIVDAHTGVVTQKWTTHQGVVATAGISPDGQTLATGGWDKTVQVHSPLSKEPVAKEDFGWSVRRVRFSPDGRFLAVAAWTPQNPIGDQESEPSAILYEVGYERPEVKGAPTELAR